MPVLRGLKPGQKGYIPPRIFRGPFGGMAPDINPQNLAEGRPYLLTNMRLEGGLWVMRGGQALLCNLGGKVTGLYDHQPGASRSLLVSFWNFVDDISTGNIIGAYDEEKTPAFTFLEAYSGGHTSPMGLFGSDVLFGQGIYLRKVADPEVNNQPPLLTVYPSYGHVSAIVEHEGVALLALATDPSDPGGDAAVFTYDGTTLTNVLTGLNIVRGFAKYRDKVIAIFDGTPNSVRVRSADGTWSAAILPSAGTVFVTYPDVCASYKDICYIPSGPDLFAYGAAGTLTRIPPATTGINSLGTGTLIAVSVFNGLLYYLYYAIGTGFVTLGVFDGVTWTPVHKELGEMLSAQSVKQYRGSLVVAGTVEVDTLPVYALVTSPGIDTAGDWVQAVLPVEYSADLGITGLLVN